ncbi:hypothetical protein SLA2020_380780 [Shorea laevis]
MEDQGLFSPCCRNGDFLSRTRFPKPYLRLFLGLTKPIFLTVQALARFEKRNWNFFSLFALSLAYSITSLLTRTIPDVSYSDGLDFNRPKSKDKKWPIHSPIDQYIAPSLRKAREHPLNEILSLTHRWKIYLETLSRPA